MVQQIQIQCNNNNNNNDNNNISNIVIIVLFILVLTVWQDKPILINGRQLRTVPTIVIAHTFCASRDTRVSYR